MATHHFLQAMEKLEEFTSHPKCSVCGMRSCNRFDFCDDHAHLERAIISCAQACAYVPMEDFQVLPNPSDVFLVYRAGELLAGKE